MNIDVETYHNVPAVPEEVDSVIILGKQFGVSSGQYELRQSPDHLSFPSRLNVIGGAMLWVPGRRLIISGNKEAYFPQAAMDYLAEHFPSIPPESYESPDVNSADTRGSAERVPRILRREGLVDPIIASVGKHGLRAAYMFDSRGTAIRGVAVTDDIVASRSPEDQKRVKSWQRRPDTIAEIAKEAIIRTIDKNGSLTRISTYLFRP